jgi:aminoglycoside 2''-phosphotransferase
VRALEAACPDRSFAGARLVDVGFGSTVLETADGLIVRVGKTAEAARGHATEAASLPDLAARLPVAVPVPCLVCRAAPGLPYGAIGYRRLEGQPCQPDTATTATSRDLGRVMAALHQLDSLAFPAMPGARAIWSAWRKLRDDTDEILRGVLSASESHRVARWWDEFLSDRIMQDYRPAVRHGDLWYGNLLIHADGSIAAVLDWEAVAVADPAQDLALSRYLGASFAADVLESYRAHGGAYDGQTEYRVQRHWELREFTGLPLAAAAEDRDEVDECIGKLRAGPILARGRIT